jgi:DNA-binding NarL/FixJ family response regulator
LLWVGTQTVIIGCRDAERVATLARAIAARSPVTVADAWPLERAVIAGTGADVGVVVLDGYPSGTALHAMAEATMARPELSVLVLGPLQPNIEVLVAIASGAFGYLPSGSTPVVVAEAVDTLLAGDAVLPRAVSLPLVQHLRWGGRGIVVSGQNGRSAALTNREWEVLVLLRQARGTGEIARRLVVSNGTVRTHVAAIVHKLGAQDRGALALATSGDRE